MDEIKWPACGSTGVLRGGGLNGWNGISQGWYIMHERSGDRVRGR